MKKRSKTRKVVVLTPEGKKRYFKCYECGKTIDEDELHRICQINYDFIRAVPEDKG
jgi:hypothetical protein